MNIDYYKRILVAYLIKRGKSNLSFWHTEPLMNLKVDPHKLKNYYMDYTSKIYYPGPFNERGVPMLNYFGDTGIQYNPDAIAQYALGHFEKYLRNGDNVHRRIFLKQADWFVENIWERDKGIGVWEYNFDFEYFKKLKKPWYTSLAQGHGISVLVRAYSLTGKAIYLYIAKMAFRAFKHPIDVNGGVKYVGEDGYVWFEEAIIKPCTHILNGFIWALWGLYDYYIATKEAEAKELFEQGIITLEHNLYKYDNEFWSTYDLAKTKFPGIASSYYHRLHIVQLKILYLLTDNEIFKWYADKWEGYQRKRFNRWLAFSRKAVFKLLYY